MNKLQITCYDKVKAVGLRGCYKHFKYKEPELYEMIEASYGDRFVQRLYSFVYGHDKAPLCEQCKTETVSFKSFDKGYSFFCSNKCVAVNKAHEAKKKRTSRDRFGSDKPSQNKDVEQKRRDTLMERYGTSNLGKIRWMRENK